MPSDDAGGRIGLGTNLNVYRADRGEWQVAWASLGTPWIELSQGRADDHGIVLEGDRRGADGGVAHRARTTFSGITAQGFDWLYEVRDAADPAQWHPAYRARCDAAESETS
jgi:hypothetical protein